MVVIVRVSVALVTVIGRADLHGVRDAVSHFDYAVCREVAPESGQVGFHAEPRREDEVGLADATHVGRRWFEDMGIHTGPEQGHDGDRVAAHFAQCRQVRTNGRDTKRQRFSQRQAVAFRE